ncbi:hypothetical protein HNP55_003216 [Paucibacter oligotrophus]|uniref:EcsC family protein n=1 Tax=Roseateles oligotrophus TaxID=1769250 RepID=A0A840LDG1_9BURK|nr:EcsC family protein [Roseateles oligotrophus]MBB4844672.1 hypothetical protein [Roseateles oligotrophus]
MSKSNSNLPMLPEQADGGFAAKVSAALLDLVSTRPDSTRQPALKPGDLAHAAGQEAARKAALAAGSLALPPGPLGWLTILPELLTVWRIQRQVVADIAALYGRTADLGREQMLYCLFRHTAAQAVRDLAVRVGERLVIQPVSAKVLQIMANKIGLKLSEKLLQKTVARWVPLAGAAAVSAYAFYDTQKVARTAIELFEAMPQAPHQP